MFHQLYRTKRNCLPGGNKQNPGRQDESLFADYLKIYITIKNPRVTTRALKTVTKMLDV